MYGPWQGLRVELFCKQRYQIGLVNNKQFWHWHYKQVPIFIAKQNIFVDKHTFKLHNGLCAGDIHAKHPKLSKLQFNLSLESGKLLNDFWYFLMLWKLNVNEYKQVFNYLC